MGGTRGFLDTGQYLKGHLRKVVALASGLSAGAAPSSR
jgi:hypothetical protein